MSPLPLTVLSSDVTFSFDWHLILNVIAGVLLAQLLVYALRWLLTKFRSGGP